MKTKTVEYVEWKDLQQEICDEMGIKMEQFRNYHEVVGGEYKDLWHLWLWYINDRLFNDSIIPHYEDEIYDDDARNWLKDRWETEHKVRAKTEGVDWIIPFFDAVDRIFAKHASDYKLHIRYYW